ncbi:PD40 domain-containing protein [Novosphingobium rosa]|uniref:PD40 domain-containing protein n=1 Tax=Novosphingobium rosa TaxID=76978 RepID=UPI00082E492B|nr:PD40 domain-containing protein [Novosphingobium rosa]
MKRRDFLGNTLAAGGLAVSLGGKLRAGAPGARVGKRGTMLMNRIGPSTSELFIADLDGGHERKLLADSGFDYNASLSADGRWLAFTSERNGDGQSDLFRASIDGRSVQPLAATPAVEDAGAISPDGTRIAFVSTRAEGTADIWLLDLRSRKLTNLTASAAVRGDPDLPHGFFRPSWSPDGRWIAFSSDRNTPWRGHDDTKGWEHTQALSIYAIRPDGTGFRRLAYRADYTLGTPKWSPDGRRIVFYEITVEGTWLARRPEGIGRVQSQIVSVDVATGERVEHTSGPGLKVFPQFLAQGEIGYLVKGGPHEGLAYTSTRAPLPRPAVRAPVWTADGKSVIYQKVGFKVRAPFTPLYSWDAQWDYRFMDVFPALSGDGTMVYTDKQFGNASVVTSRPDGSDRKVVFNVDGKGLDPVLVKKGLAGAFQPAWSPDGQWIAFGLGQWFQERAHGKATLMRVRLDGSAAEPLTDGTINAGFPSYSADGRFIVYRVWGDGELGLRILDLESRKVRVLTKELDNLPGWSPDGQRIVFTRKVDTVNYDVFTIRPDGGDLRRLTSHGANDGHAVWTADGRIAWSSGRYGFRDEAALYDNTFQQYGQIWLMNADGSGQHALTDSIWEDSMPLYLPAR